MSLRCGDFLRAGISPPLLDQAVEMRPQSRQAAEDPLQLIARQLGNDVGVRGGGEDGLETLARQPLRAGRAAAEADGELVLGEKRLLPAVAALAAQMLST